MNQNEHCGSKFRQLAHVRTNQRQCELTAIVNLPCLAHADHSEVCFAPPVQNKWRGVGDVAQSAKGLKQRLHDAELRRLRCSDKQVANCIKTLTAQMCRYGSNEHVT